MIYLFGLICPFLALASGVVSLFGLVRFIANSE